MSFTEDFFNRLFHFMEYPERIVEILDSKISSIFHNKNCQSSTRLFSPFLLTPRSSPRSFRLSPKCLLPSSATVFLCRRYQKALLRMAVLHLQVYAVCRL